MSDDATVEDEGFGFGKPNVDLSSESPGQAAKRARLALRDKLRQPADNTAVRRVPAKKMQADAEAALDEQGRKQSRDIIKQKLRAMRHARRDQA